MLCAYLLSLFLTMLLALKIYKYLFNIRLIEGNSKCKPIDEEEHNKKMKEAHKKNNLKSHKASIANIDKDTYRSKLFNSSSKLNDVKTKALRDNKFDCQSINNTTDENKD